MKSSTQTRETQTSDTDGERPSTGRILDVGDTDFSRFYRVSPLPVRNLTLMSSIFSEMKEWL